MVSAGRVVLLTRCLLVVVSAGPVGSGAGCVLCSSVGAVVGECGA